MKATRSFTFLNKVLFISILTTYLLGTSAALVATSSRAWFEQQILVPSNPIALSWFGLSVALEGNTAMVSQSLAGGEAVYVYHYNGSAWVETQILTASDGVVGDMFGYALAIEGNTALISAPYRDSHRGAVYAFTYNGSSWQEQQILTIPNLIAEAQFGSALDIDGTTAVITAPEYLAPLGQGGEAYIFVNEGIQWVQQAKLKASDASPGDDFGYIGAAVSGDHVIVGAPHDNPVGDGSFYAGGSASIFVRNGTLWTQQQKLLGDLETDSEFGVDVALSGDLVLVGAIYENSLYAYQWEGSTWQRVQKIPDTTFPPLGQAGWSLDLQGTLAVTGVQYDVVDGVGGAMMFQWDGSAWNAQTFLHPSDGMFEDRFGCAVALNDQRVIVGAVQHDTNGLNASGEAYIFADDSFGQSTPTPTPINTPAPAVELVSNGGMETDADANKLPDDWTGKNLLGDKLKCDDVTKVHGGLCAFQFKGSVAENTQLVQNADLTGLVLVAGQNVTLSGWYKAPKAVASGKFLVKIKYSDAANGKINLPIVTAADYVNVTNSVTLATANVTVIKLQIIHTSTSGKVWVDDVSLTVGD